MPKASKKVVLLIVEGICDEHLLANRLKELYKDRNILFEIQSGDILYNPYSKKKSQIKSTIGEIVSLFIKKKKFRESDMLGVLHIVDTDGCLIPEENVIVDTEQTMNTNYQLENIVVKNEDQRVRILDRNKREAETFIL